VNLRSAPGFVSGHDFAACRKLSSRSVSYQSTISLLPEKLNSWSFSYQDTISLLAEISAAGRSSYPGTISPLPEKLSSWSFRIRARFRSLPKTQQLVGFLSEHDLAVCRKFSSWSFRIRARFRSLPKTQQLVGFVSEHDMRAAIPRQRDDGESPGL
jgi:hypothetical protein